MKMAIPLSLSGDGWEREAGILQCFPYNISILPCWARCPSTPSRMRSFSHFSSLSLFHIPSSHLLISFILCIGIAKFKGVSFFWRGIPTSLQYSNTEFSSETYSEFCYILNYVMKFCSPSSWHDR